MTIGVRSLRGDDVRSVAILIDERDATAGQHKTQGRKETTVWSGPGIASCPLPQTLPRRLLQDAQERDQIRFILLRQIKLLDQIEKLHDIFECQ